MINTKESLKKLTSVVVVYTTAVIQGRNNIMQGWPFEKGSIQVEVRGN